MRRVGLACLMLALGSATARAESGRDAFVSCAYGTPEVTPPAGSIPANWPSFTIALLGTSVNAESTRMTRMSDGHVVPLAFATRSGAGSPVEYAPLEPLVVGETYVVDHPMCAGLAPRSTVYVIADPITAPTSLGTIVVRGPFAANTQRGACHRAYFVEIDLTPDAAFASSPWSTLSWYVAVDGTSPPALPYPITTDFTRLALPCGEHGASIAEGMHTLRAVAGPLRFPEGLAAPVTFETAAVAFTALCSDAVRVDATTLAPLTADEMAFWDTDVGTCGMDAATSNMDAGSSLDGAAHTEPDTHPNCGCALSGRGPSSMSWLLALLVASRRAASRGRRRAGIWLVAIATLLAAVAPARAQPNAPRAHAPVPMRAWVAVADPTGPPGAPRAVLLGAREALEDLLPARPDVVLGSLPGGGVVPAPLPLRAYVIEVRIGELRSGPRDAHASVELHIRSLQGPVALAVTTGSATGRSSGRPPISPHAVPLDVQTVQAAVRSAYRDLAFAIVP